MKLLKSAWGIVRENRTAYIVINIVYYGLVGVFMVIAAFNRPLQDMMLKSIGASFTSGPLALVGSAYVNAEVLKAIGLTFLVNLFLASFLQITVPSAIIPFSGLLMGILRAILWGMIFSPLHPDIRPVILPHLAVILLEGQAYIFVLLASYVQGRAFLSPKSVGVEGHGRGYLEGLKRTGKLYILVVLTLLIAAIYEVFEVLLMARLIG